MGKKITLLIITLFLSFIPKSFAAENSPTLWKYQCIDTMKISRDKARDWLYKTDLAEHIQWEMKTIKDMGANCVAIDTPYDEEFVPYLTKWVQAARDNNLHIWFRGNFAGWEEWFNYPKLSDTTVFFDKTQNFITKHQDLFVNGDIFTAAPEAEDGGPFNQVEPNEYDAYRKFLTDEYVTEKTAFEQINKKVEINWFSMNGGLAMRMMDQQTADNLGNIITIDHYIKTAPEMGAFITYFKNNFHSNVVVGEFGAPIPDINGSMTEDLQAQFVESLFQELYKNKSSIAGINYWDLYDGSTALINPDQTPRKVVQVIKKYYSPVIVQGTITNNLGEKVQNIFVKTSDGFSTTTTDANGNYQLVIPQESIQILAGNENYNFVGNMVNGATNLSLKQNYVLKPINPDIIYQIKTLWKNFILVHFDKSWLN